MNLAKTIAGATAFSFMMLFVGAFISIWGA